MKIKGIASTPEQDSEGEILEPMGFDLSRFLSIGYLNWNHQSKNSADKIIGEPTVAKITPEGNLYVEGILYNDHPLAESVYHMAEVLKKNNSTRRLGFSIEGRATERDIANPKRITRALLTGLAVTPTPVNCSTYLDLVKGIQSDDYINYEYDKESVLEKAETSSIYLYEFTNNGKRMGITKGFDVVDIEKEEEAPSNEQMVAKAMKDFTAGKLKDANGLIVTDKEQAMAIALGSVEKCMDIAATKPLVPESLDKKPKNLEPVIKKAIISGLLSLDQINDICKGGEGSHGGQVIGHTRSGKPIYANANHPEHSGFTKNDHQDAIHAHDKLDRSNYNDPKESGQHRRQIMSHKSMMKK